MAQAAIHAVEETLPSAQAPERRIEALDGLRGLMAVMVVLSHYFGEVPHGLQFAMCGWIAVDMFFVLSGFLIGKLILEKRDHANFFSVFYVRRFYRIIPAYMLTVVGIWLLTKMIAKPWVDAEIQFPLWSYLAFVQGIYMTLTQSIGAHWLAPTWTLAVEEHFYLLAPAVMVFAPRRWLIPALVLTAASAVAMRVAVYSFGFANDMAALSLLPGRADILVCGLLAAVAYKTPNIQWAPITFALRLAPVVCLIATLILNIVSKALFGILNPLIIGVGCASFLLCIVLGTPEARRFHSRTLRFLGDNAYCLYLTHLPVLGLMHGLILGSKPDLASPAQWATTFAALPVCLLVGRGMTKLVEEPLTRYGRRWRWSTELRSRVDGERSMPLRPASAL